MPSLITSCAGDADTFVSVDSVGDTQVPMYSTDFLNTLSPNGISPHRLILIVSHLLFYCSVLLSVHVENRVFIPTSHSLLQPFPGFRVIGSESSSQSVFHSASL